jgi:chemotaxis response regulator CheB
MVVLPRPGGGISSLRAIPARSCRMPVVLAEGTGELLAGTSYIGGPDRHLTRFTWNRALLVIGAGHGLRNQAIDTLFQPPARHAARHGAERDRR